MSHVIADNFKRSKFIHTIANKDLDFAIDLVQEYGGLSIHIPHWDSIKAKADLAERNANIVSQKQKLVGNKRLAKQYGISIRHVRRICSSLLPHLGG